MKKIELIIELEYDEELMHGKDKDAKEWFFDDILKGDGLYLGERGELGDEIGTIKVIKITKE